MSSKFKTRVWDTNFRFCRNPHDPKAHAWSMKNSIRYTFFIGNPVVGGNLNTYYSRSKLDFNN